MARVSWVSLSNVLNAMTTSMTHLSKRIITPFFAFFNNTKELGFEGDVSVSKPAKNPLLKITEEDRKKDFKLHQFQRHRSTDRVRNGRKRYAS